MYIEESDFREEDHKTYYGLAPGKMVMLRYVFDSLQALSLSLPIFALRSEKTRRLSIDATK